MPCPGHDEFGMAKEFKIFPTEASRRSEDTPGAKWTGVGGEVCGNISANRQTRS